MTFQPKQFPQPHARHLEPSTLSVPSLAIRLARRLADEGARAVVVGGFVRDALWGIPHGDVDLEVYGMPPERLESLAREVAKARVVGRDFGVLKVGPLDVSLPRAIRRPGREGYLLGDHTMSLADAARRRDFTINAIAWDPLTGHIYDPHQGVEDLEARRLTPVARDTFVEDPLRALRSIQFLARFPLEPSPETLELCQELAPELPALPKERIFEELKKLLLQGNRIYYALEVARKTGIISTLWPELERLHTCPQDPTWHPEGNVWTHTLLALEAAIPLKTGEPRDDLALMLAVLCHDIGKPDTSWCDAHGIIRSYGHERRGSELAESFLARLTDERKLTQQVITLVEYHRCPLTLYQQRSSAAAVRRLATRVNIELLVRVARADNFGRTTPEAVQGLFPAGDWLLSMAKKLEVQNQKPRPIVKGKHLLEIGVQPGPGMGKLLKELYDHQLEGTFNDLEGGLQLARTLLGQKK